MQLRKIFVLSGKEKCGKSESIRKIFDLLKSEYPSAEVAICSTGDDDDIKAIITGVNGLKIGIESAGDPTSRLKQSLIDFENAGCDIIFCASRTRGMTVDWINDHSGKYTIDWTHQNYIEDSTAQTKNNDDIARVLIKKAGL
jgi:hypothetical protein